MTHRFGGGGRSSALPVRTFLALSFILLVALLAGCSDDQTEGGDGAAAGGSRGSVEVGVDTGSDGTEGTDLPTGPEGVGVQVPTSEGSGTYVDLNPDELAAMLENKDFVFVNTHVPYEGEIEQTDLFLPYDQAAAKVSELPPEKDAKIVVYCRSDRMSRIAIEEWVKAGYTNLYNLDGGFVAWVVAGYELLRK